MDDLIRQYFQRDITEAEEQALSERLLSSDEDAMAFREEAARVYAKYGLPKPQWRGPDNVWPLSRAGKWQWIWLGAVIAALALSAGWWFKTLSEMTSANRTSLENPSLTPSPIRPKVKKMAPPVAEKVIDESGKKSISPAPPPLSPVTNSPGGLFTQPKPAPVLANPQGGASAAYSNLSVLVRRATPGEIMVRVLNEGGAEVALLYRGTIQAGSWVFEWDGKLVDGRPAGAGVYTIEVKSGETVQRKSLKIK